MPRAETLVLRQGLEYGLLRVISAERSSDLLVRAGSRVCAISLRHVVETMPPLTIERVANASLAVLGVSIIRGTPTPVVDLGALCEGASIAAIGRFVTVRTGERLVALAVDSVLAVRQLTDASLHALPMLSGDSSASAIEAFGHLDDELLVVLRTARLVPEDVWAAIPAHAGSAS
jgi:purine-binding chemotaxis protein CheW